ncbi:FACT complex subunit SSRP1 [Linum grandiflorum]
MADGHLYNNISIGGRGGTNLGQFKIYPGSIMWKKQGGGKTVDVEKSDVAGLTWMKVPRSNQLGVQIKDGLYYKFTGFRDQDVISLNNYFQSYFGMTPEEKQLSVSGRNWGDVHLSGNMLTFLVGSKQAFEVSLADVAQTSMQGKNDVVLEFHVDDTTGANEKDSLMELSFHVPNSNTQFVGDENRPAAQVFREKIMSMADVGAGAEEAVVTFESVGILTPRGRYNVELHVSFLRLQGQANDFKIQYSSVVRLFLLPKSNQPHTFVIVTLDPPIRKGQTLYPHIVLQFNTDEVGEQTLAMNEDLLNTKYKDKLEASYKGLIHEVFTTILRGLSSAKVTKPGKFRSCQDGYAVKSSLKAEDGLLYPLEKSFFFLPKPPTLILHEEIDYVEFERHAAGGSNMQYFDFLVKLKTEQEHLFRNIQRNEYHNLFEFVRGKGLKVMNLGGSQPTAGVPIMDSVVDQPVDSYLVQIQNEAGAEESDEEDEDFVAEKDDSGSPTDDSGDESNGSDSENEKEASLKPSKKEVSSKEASSSKATVSKKKGKDVEGDGSKKRKQPKKKKDPNAPKKAMTSYVIFCQRERETIKKENPGISFGEISKALGDKWKTMSAEEKQPYSEMAKADSKRYQEEASGYKPQPDSAIDVDMDSD